MKALGTCSIGALIALCASVAAGDIIADYTVDAGGNNNQPLNGLSARGTFRVSGSQLEILLENTSTGVPSGFEAADSLLVSLGINLPGVSITGGQSAVIGPGSTGLGAWSSRGPGQGVGEEWIWTNGGGGDLMMPFRQVVSTSQGQGGGPLVRFDGGSGSVGGPFGGIAAAPPLRAIPTNQPAVSDSILFALDLSGPLTEIDLAPAVAASIVEFGSDARYLQVPEPASLGLLSLMVLIRGARRR